MGAEPALRPGSQDLLQERRLAVPVDRAAAETEAAAAAVVVDDRGDAERCASSASITSITLTTSP